MQNVLVTGGLGNLGKSVVDALSTNEYRLHLAVRDIMEDTTNGVQYYTTDLTNENQCELLINKIMQTSPSIDAAVFLAGGFVGGSLEETSIDDINKMILLNFTTAFHCVKNLIEQYKKQGAGIIIFIGANAAMNANRAKNNLAYSLSKQLLFNYVTLINAAENHAGITAHILLPNALDTELNRKMMPNADFSKWTSVVKIAETIKNIVERNELKTVIEF